MRNSDLSSYVCSSVLQLLFHLGQAEQLGGLGRLAGFQLHLPEQAGRGVEGRLLGVDLLGDARPVPALHALDRKCVVQVKSVLVWLDRGCRRIMKKNNINHISKVQPPKYSNNTY